MKTGKDLADAVRQGLRPVVTFGKGIEDKEGYPEAGMRARVVAASDAGNDGMLKVVFEFESFADHNRPLESRNYYDKAGKPTLTAREAGFYTPEEHLYFDADEELSGTLTVTDEGSVLLFEAFKAEGSTLSYVEWLERQLLALKAGGA